MSDPNLYDDDELNDDPNESSVIKALRKQQRDQAKELAALREQAEQGQSALKENALFKANLGDLNEAQRGAILATATDATPEAFRSQAELLGFVEPVKPVVAEDELAAQQRIAEAGAGGEGVNPANYEAEVAGARNPAELTAVMAKYGRSPAVVD